MTASPWLRARFHRKGECMSDYIPNDTPLQIISEMSWLLLGCWWRRISTRSHGRTCRRQLPRMCEAQDIIYPNPNDVHTEMFSDPQVHTLLGLQFSTSMPGFLRAIRLRCSLGPSLPQNHTWLPYSEAAIQVLCTSTGHEDEGLHQYSLGMITLWAAWRNLI